MDSHEVPRMTQFPPETLDIEAIERAVVRARMYLHFRLSPKGPRVARKVFCLGPAKTATSSLYAMFRENGLKSLHSSGDWPVAEYETFADRGDYRPFAAYAATYPEAVFVLNTRGLRGYLTSYASHLQRHLPEAGRKPLSVQYFINRTRRRNRHMAEVMTHFAGTDRLILVNIDRPGAINFVAERLGLTATPQPHRHKTTRQALPENAANIQTALDRLGLADQADEALVFPHLLPAPLREVWGAALPDMVNRFI